MALKRIFFLSLSLLTVSLVAIAFAVKEWNGQFSAQEHSAQQPLASFGAEQVNVTTDVMNPHRILLLKAEREGIEKVRGEFETQLNLKLTQSERNQKLPFSYSSGSPGGISAASVMDWAMTWSHAEARAIYRGAAIPDNFEKAIWKPLFEAATASNTSSLHALKEIEQSRDKHIQIVDPKTGEAVVDPIRVEVFDRVSNRTIRMHEKYSEGVFLRLADLAKLADRKDLLKELYQAYGKPLPKLGERNSRLGELKSVEEFWAYDSPMSETLYGIPKPIVHKAPVPKPQFTVTPAEQQVIRTVIETFLKALVAQDLKTIKRVSGDANLKLLEEKFTERVTSKPIYAYDLTNAQYKFTRDQKAGPVQVEVDGFEIEIDFGGQRQWRGARKTYRVIFVQGAPKLILNPTEK